MQVIVHVDSESERPEGMLVDSESERPEGMHVNSESERPEGMHVDSESEIPAIRDDSQDSIMCDSCLIWHHFTCTILWQSPKSRVCFCHTCCTV